MSNFFPLPRGDRWYLLAILVFAGLAFLPWTHHMQIAGMAVLGWMMAALMVFAPLLALLRLWREAASSRGAKISKTE